MHDRSLHDESENLEQWISRMKAVVDRARELAEPSVTIDGKRYYVFRPLAGLAGYYDRQGE